MERDARHLVDACMICSKAKHPSIRYKIKPAMKTIAWAWNEIAVDSIGPYGEQKVRTLTIIDTLTRLIKVLPAQDGSSAEAACLLYRNWLNRYPRPVRCIYDGGSEFKKEFHELLESYGIEHEPTTVWKPLVNAVIEHVHRVIGDKMCMKTIKTMEDWVQSPNNTTFALRAANHVMTNILPAQQAFGRDMIFDMKHETNCIDGQLRKVDQINKKNQWENNKRVSSEYTPVTRSYFAATRVPKGRPCHSSTDFTRSSQYKIQER